MIISVFCLSGKVHAVVSFLVVPDGLHEIYILVLIIRQNIHAGIIILLTWHCPYVTNNSSVVRTFK